MPYKDLAARLRKFCSGGASQKPWLALCIFVIVLSRHLEPQYSRQLKQQRYWNKDWSRIYLQSANLPTARGLRTANVSLFLSAEDLPSCNTL